MHVEQKSGGMVDSQKLLVRIVVVRDIGAGLVSSGAVVVVLNMELVSVHK